MVMSTRASLVNHLQIPIAIFLSRGYEYRDLGPKSLPRSSAFMTALSDRDSGVCAFLDPLDAAIVPRTCFWNKTTNDRACLDGVWSMQFTADGWGMTRNIATGASQPVNAILTKSQAATTSTGRIYVCHRIDASTFYTDKEKGSSRLEEPTEFKC